MKTLNQKGNALLMTTVILSGAIFVSLSMSYLYTVNRIRYHAQIKEAYKLVNASEGAAKAVKAAWDKAAIGCTPAPCSTAAIAASMQAGQPFAMPATFRFSNPDNPDPLMDYIFNTAPPQANGGSIEFKLKNKIEDKEFSKLETFVAKLDKFFQGREPVKSINMPSDIRLVKPTMVGWLIHESKALAQTSPSGGVSTHNDGSYGVIVNYNSAPNCQTAPTTPGCARCSGTGTNACVALSMVMNGNTVNQSIRISTGADTF